MNHIDTMKLALEALEVLGWQPTEEAMDYRDNAITALREALAEQPAQRTWVGLTDKERNIINRHNVYVSDIISATEAKLREKNT